MKFFDQAYLSMYIMTIKSIFFGLLLFFLINVFPAHGQQNPPRLIVRADDMGFAHAANVAILKTVKEGIATSVEVLVPAPWFPEVVSLLEENPSIDVGVHLTLSSEWDNMKLKPLSHSPSLTNEDGYFYSFIRPNERAPGQSLSEHDWTIEDVEREFRAQIELAQKKIPQITHVSAHMGCFTISPEVDALTKKLTREYGIDIDPVDFAVARARYIGPKETSEEKVQSMIKMLESLKAGETYLFVDHPAMDTPEIRAIYHVGYEQVAIDRQGVTDSWTDPRVKEAIRKLGIKLISYADLLK